MKITGMMGDLKGAMFVMRSIKSLFAAVAMLAVLCTCAWAEDIDLTDQTTWENDKTYVVSGSITITGRITVNGSVTLRLEDGCELIAEHGITVSGTNSLTIEGGSDESTAGRLIARVELSNESSDNSYDAAIGGRRDKAGGTITIKGGKVTAYGVSGAGIGGGSDGSGGTITITGGFVDAEATTGGAAIGGGGRGDGGSITIEGGIVKASAGWGAAGIGGGVQGSGGIIKITSGTVTAYASGAGAGIGGGRERSGGEITISGGIVKAESGGNGAGIGGGGDGSGGIIKITNATVTAVSYTAGAGIGGGSGGSGGEITITGSTVTASAHRGGAGIGGGNGRACGTVNITDSTVTAISVGYEWGNGDIASGAGIGGGQSGAGGTVTITDSTVTASADGGDGIGRGYVSPLTEEEIAQGNIPDIGRGTLSIGGSSWIDTSSVGAATSGPTSCVLFEGKDGKVYGSPTIKQDVEIPNGKTLEVPTGATLTIQSGKKLTNKGTIVREGTISGTVDNKGAFFENGSGVVAGDCVLTSDRTVTGTLTVQDGVSFTIGDGVSLTVDEGADMNIGANATVNVKQDANLTLDEDAKMTFKNSAKLNVEQGATVDASKGTIENANGKIRNDGELKLPGTMEPEEIKDLGITGSGDLELGDARFRNTGAIFSTITVTSGGHGKVKAVPNVAATGDKVRLVYAADPGYGFYRWKVIAPQGVSIRNDMFTMPDAEVEIKAMFKLSSELPPETTPEIYDGSIILDATTSEWDARTGGGVSIVIRQSIDDFFDEVWIDDQALAPDEFTARASNSSYLPGAISAAAADSIKITISSEVIKRHVTTDGEHDLTVGFARGKATHRFKVIGLADVNDDTQTRSSSGGGCEAGAAIVALAALAMMKRRKK